MKSALQIISVGRKMGVTDPERLRMATSCCLWPDWTSVDVAHTTSMSWYRLLKETLNRSQPLRRNCQTEALQVGLLQFLFNLEVFRDICVSYSSVVSSLIGRARVFHPNRITHMCTCAGVALKGTFPGHGQTDVCSYCVLLPMRRMDNDCSLFLISVSPFAFPLHHRVGLMLAPCRGGCASDCAAWRSKGRQRVQCGTTRMTTPRL